MANLSRLLSTSSPVMSCVERALVTGSVERGTSDTCSFSPHSSVFAFCHSHKLVSIRTPLDCKPDCQLNPQSEGRNECPGRVPEPWLPLHTTLLAVGRPPSCLLLGGRLGILVLYFESFTQPAFPKRVPAPTPNPEL